MTYRSLLYGASAVAAMAVMGLVPSNLAAQEIAAAKPADTPRAAKASAPTPRSADGHPDLTGVWRPGGAGAFVEHKPDGSTLLLLGGRSDSKDKDPDQKSGRLDQDPDAVAKRMADPNKPAYKPELVAKVKELADNENKMDPAFFCKPEGVPRIGPPNEIIQTPGKVVFLYENEKGNTYRVIPIDKPHRTDVDDLYYGDSVGHWDGNTLVVDANSFTDDTWLSIDGYFHSTAMHVIERVSRDGNTLHYQATVEDPNVLTKPWVMNPRTLQLKTEPGDELFEQGPCIEKDESHIVNHDHH
jgi:hypothetical protein